MRLLLDTVTFLWFVQGSSELSAAAKAAPVKRSNEAFVNAVSAWEIAVKNVSGRLPLPERPVLEGHLADVITVASSKT